MRMETPITQTSGISARFSSAVNSPFITPLFLFSSFVTEGM